MKAKAQFIRFRLWHTFIVFFVTAIALWAIPAVTEWYQWRHVHDWLEQSIAGFVANPDKQHIYQLNDGARLYAIANYEADWNPRRITIHTTDVRRNEYFILPPEKWAATPEEALRHLKKHYR